ncbi:hypothetical protein B9Q01_03820 [Candidatus Marsarchaeota G1 archaeon OSP_D]|jgi:hypothetical protein|uniref:Uncharacterized protein n=1 Tax=Candidatus Marsarchaeota G1 archaeon OSP_D TaxID=1978155 RepID=A0A2R6ABA9_9ARCH|nr:MAG: hypothetical protein B9Q01_03820 [Candidatus Marsarchaeota G1 archaeon OSP_D]
MSKEKRKLGVPKYYYWAKNPRLAADYKEWSRGVFQVKSGDPIRGFANREQRRLYWILTGFKLAKIVALGVFVYLIYVLH